MLLVTGTQGHVGRAILAELADQPVRVRAVVQNPADVPVRAANIEYVVADIENSATLVGALEGVKTAFLSSPFQPLMAETQIAFLERAKAAGVKRVVQLSAVGADAHRCCVRAINWHGQIEDALLASGLGHTRIRPTFYFQNLLTRASIFAPQGVIVGPFRNAVWTWVDARDVGAVAAAALRDERHAGQLYTVTGSESLTCAAFADRMSAALNKPIRYQDISSNEMHGRLQASGMPPVIIAATLELWDAFVSGFLHVEPNNTVQEILGRPPRTLEDFVRDHAEQFSQVTP